MITFDPGAGMPTHWVLCFYRNTSRPWMDRLPIGRYKHVRAFGCVQQINTWMFYDVGFHGRYLVAARGDAANALMLEWLREADAIGMPSGKARERAPWFGWCVPSVRHLIGLDSGALRPDALWRDCLRNGGTIIEPAKPAAA